MSSVVWMIFVVVVEFVLPHYVPIGVNTSACLSVVSVTILAKLDRRCGHGVEWQDLLANATSLVLLVNAQVHGQGRVFCVQQGVGFTSTSFMVTAILFTVSSTYYTNFLLLFYH